MHKHPRNNKRWTQKEDDFIRNNNSRLSVSDIAKQLGRSNKATRGRIERLGIKLSTFKRADKKYWSEDEIRILIENKNLPVKELSKLLPRRKYSAIYNKSRLLGIKRKTQKGYHFDRDGRKIIYIKHGVGVAEHRYLIEKKLGRKLSRKEQVHHINGDKTDNRMENLHLFTGAAKHLNAHWSLKELIKPLMERNIIKFNGDTGRYELCENR